MLPALLEDTNPIERAYKKGGFFKGYKESAKELRTISLGLARELDNSRAVIQEREREIAELREKMCEIQQIAMSF
ncbi:MAG: hypothetical protein ACRC6V_09395 [Bacteroidales bacterium]